MRKVAVALFVLLLLSVVLTMNAEQSKSEFLEIGDIVQVGYSVIRVQDIAYQHLAIFQVNFSDGSSETVILHPGENLSSKISQKLDFDMTLLGFDISVSGYLLVWVEFTVPEGTEITVIRDVFLRIISTPSEADVYLDYNWIGKTPIEELRITPGEYFLKITKDGL